MLSSGLTERETYLRLGLGESEFQVMWQGIAEKVQSLVPSNTNQFEGLSAYERIERRKLEGELWAAEARLNALMDISPDAVFLVNGRSGRILKVNNQVSIQLGYSPRELVGQPVEMLVDPEKRDVHVAFRNAFLNNVRKREMGYHPPIHAVKKDGTTVELDIALTATAATDDVMVVCRPVLVEAHTQA